MPEGDTLWNHAADLRPALVGKPVEDLRVHRNRKKGPRRGVEVQSVEAAGKHLLITFDDGVVLHTHLQMTGEWHLYEAGQRWRREPGAMRALVAVPGAVANGIGEGAGDLRNELRGNFHAVLQGVLDKMDLVTREEFDVQRLILEQALARLDRIEAAQAARESTKPDV